AARPTRPTTATTTATAAPAGSSIRAAAAARAARVAASGQALPALLCVAPALLAGGLDLGQEPLVFRPLDGDLLVDELLDRLERERARLVGEADGLAGGAGAGGAADAVHVVLGV